LQQTALSQVRKIVDPQQKDIQKFDAWLK